MLFLSPRISRLEAFTDRKVGRESSLERNNEKIRGKMEAQQVHLMFLKLFIPYFGSSHSLIIGT